MSLHSVEDCIVILSLHTVEDYIVIMSLHSVKGYIVIMSLHSVEYYRAIMSLHRLAIQNFSEENNKSLTIKILLRFLLLIHKGENILPLTIYM